MSRGKKSLATSVCIPRGKVEFLFQIHKHFRIPRRRGIWKSEAARRVGLQRQTVNFGGAQLAPPRRHHATPAGDPAGE